ncbi:hypothetical protein NKI59_32325 [Mesorhizobium sp. M0598]|uniref:hypothetical protein n=1 Tax=Mesorhizobium sp. M0598 TaxID=2956968 RepID=UPI0033354C0A
MTEERILKSGNWFEPQNWRRESLGVGRFGALKRKLVSIYFVSAEQACDPLDIPMAKNSRSAKPITTAGTMSR